MNVQRSPEINRRQFYKFQNIVEVSKNSKIANNFRKISKNLQISKSSKISKNLDPILQSRS